MLQQFKQYFKQIWKSGLHSVFWLSTSEFKRSNKNLFFFDLHALYQKYVEKNNGFTVGCFLFLFANFIFCISFHANQFSTLAPLATKFYFFYCLFYFLILYAKFWVTRVVCVFFYVFTKHGGYGLTEKQALENKKKYPVLIGTISVFLWITCLLVLYWLPDGRDAMNVFILDNTTWSEFLNHWNNSLVCFFDKIAFWIKNKFSQKTEKTTSNQNTEDSKKKSTEETETEETETEENNPRAFKTDLKQELDETLEHFTKRVFMADLDKHIKDLNSDEIKAWEKFWGWNAPDFRPCPWETPDHQYEKSFVLDSDDPDPLNDEEFKHRIFNPRYGVGWNPTHRVIEECEFADALHDMLDGGAREHRKGRFRKFMNELRLNEVGALRKYKRWCAILEKLRKKKDGDAF